MELNFARGFDGSISDFANRSVCTNYYPKDVAGRPALFGTPGVTQLATTGTGSQDKNRGAHLMEEIVYFVNNVTLSRFNEDNTVDNLGTVTGSGRVSMANNGFQLMILVPGGSGFIFNKNDSSFVEITDLDFVANGLPQYVTFIAGYFMVSTDSKKIIVSSLNDGTTWNALDFGTAESNPDPVVAPYNFRNEAHFFGSITMEGQENIGGSGFPFQNNGIYLDKGLFAPLSLTTASGTFMWIGGGENERPGVLSFNGGSTPIKISNTGVDLLLAELSTTEMSQVVGFSYSQDNSFFVGWELPNETIVYDQQTQPPKWHIRRSVATDVAGALQTVGWRVTSPVTAYGKLICFDNIDGRIGEISRSVFTEYGEEIRREFDVEPMRSPDGNTFVIPRIEVTVESGVGDATTPNPKMVLRISRDGKRLRPGRLRSIGKKGEFEKRAVWRINGRAKRYALLNLAFSEPVKAVVVGVTA